MYPLRLATAILGLSMLFTPGTTAGADLLCDATYQNCRVHLIHPDAAIKGLIEAETVGIDVAFWFMEDDRYATALIERWRAGVPVRVIMDTDANASYPGNVPILDKLKNAGIPMLQKTSGGIVHWKMMIFAGQNKVQFSGANYSPHAFVPVQPYVDFIDEVIYFTDDPAWVSTFKTRFDDVWISTAGYTPYANISGTRTREYPVFTCPTGSTCKELNFVPFENFRDRSIPRYNAETVGIDTVMFRITDRRHTDAIIAAMARGVPFRLITDEDEYRDRSRLWHAYNVDLLYAAGQQYFPGRETIRMEGHLGSLHQKSTLLHSQKMTIFGSSNWTSPSASSQLEHNIFTKKAHVYTFFSDQFERKWTNATGHTETKTFVPLPPDRPVYVSPADASTGMPQTVTLKWHAGIWAHKYDIYIGTVPDPPLLIADEELGPSETSTDYVSYTVTNLLPGTTYYWKIVSKTMANVPKSGVVWSFRTSGTPPASGLPSGWQSQDIGAVGAAGSASYSNGTFEVRGAGADIWGASDAFHYAYTSLTGDGTVVARVAAISGTQAWTKMGVMIRGSTSPSSAFALMLVSSGKGLAFQRRTADGASAVHTSGGGGTAPRWVRLVRAGNVITASVSSDGASWTTVGSDTFNMASSVLVGLTAHSHDTSQVATAWYDNVSISSGTTPPPPPPTGELPTGWISRDIGAVGVAGSAAHDNGTFTVKGAGADVWGTSDAFHYAYTTLDGDGTIAARVASISGTQAWTKIGVMIRGSTSASAAYAFMLVSVGKGLAFQRRTADGVLATHTAGGSGTAPRWVRLTRAGDVITAAVSSDGSSWTTVGSDTFSMPSSVLVGLASHSHDTSRLATGVFDNVSVTSGGSSPTASLPAGWDSGDVGAVGVAGSAAESGGTFTVKGSGADIWGAADAFHLAYRSLSGDGTIIARVAGIAGSEAWTKVGVMIRDSLDRGSAYAFMLVSAAKGLAFQRRTSAGALATHTSAGSGTAPRWVKLERSGDLITASVSSDGASWQVVGSDSFTMGGDALVGLAVTSHDNTRLATGTFDNVDVTG